MSSLVPVYDACLKPYHTLSTSARAQQLYTLTDTAQLPELLSALCGTILPICILGEGSNVLFQGDYAGCVIVNQLKGRQILRQDNEHVWLSVAAGENWHDCVMWCNAHAFYGLENLALIPGTVGAAPIQNIAAYGAHFADVCDSVECVDLRSGETIHWSTEACEFAYRDSRFKRPAHQSLLITRVIMKLHLQPQWQLSYPQLAEALADGDQADLTAQAVSEAVMRIRQRKLPDPKQLANAGSFFKNPTVSPSQANTLRQVYPTIPAYPHDNAVKLSAAWLIEQCGFKGYRRGDAGTYEQHALVLVNHGGATGAELWALANDIQRAVAARFNIMLEPEPSCLGTAVSTTT